MPIRLSPAALAQARDFVAAKGRLLDAVLIELALGQGSVTDVLTALAPYQNEDGGFGHALEPDLRTPASTAIATSAALQILRRIGATGDHPMLLGAVGYLLETLDPERGVWPIIGPAVDEAPHAPWWNYGPDLATAWNGFRFNPTADLLATLIRHADLVSADLLADLQAKMQAAIDTTPVLDAAYDLMAAWRLAETPDLPAPLAAGLARLLPASLAALSPDDRHVNFLEFGSGPHAALAAARFAAAADQAIDSQHPDGNWAPFWDWSETSAPGWFAAEADWNSLLTRHTIEVLAAHDRIER